MRKSRRKKISRRDAGSIQVRINAEEKVKFMAAAEVLGFKKLSPWIRMALHDQCEAQNADNG